MGKGERPARGKVSKFKTVSTASSTIQDIADYRKMRLKSPKETTFIEPYPQDKLQSLLQELTSEDENEEIKGAVEFTEHYDEIVLAINKTPNLTKTEVMDLVALVISKNLQLFFRKLETERHVKSLSFLKQSNAIPKNIKERATKSLKQMGVTEPQNKTRSKQPELSITVKPISQKELASIMSDLKNPAPEVSIPAVIKFLTTYQAIARAVNKTPDLSVTEVNKGAASVLEKHHSTVILMLSAKQNIKALNFLASFSAAPLKIRESAKQTLEKIQRPKEERVTSAVASEKTRPKAKPEVVAIERVKPQIAVITAKEYTADQIKQLCKMLESNTPKAITAAIEFVTNYNKVSAALMKVPLLSVTDMTKKAVGVIVKNCDKIFGILEKTRNTEVLEFLATSSKIPLNIQKRAVSILEKIVSVGGKRKERKPREINIPPELINKAKRFSKQMAKKKVVSKEEGDDDKEEE